MNKITQPKMEVPPYYRILDKELFEAMSDAELEEAVYDISYLGLTENNNCKQSQGLFLTIHTTMIFEDMYPYWGIEIFLDGWVASDYGFDFDMLIKEYKSLGMGDFSHKVDRLITAHKKENESKSFGFGKSQVYEIQLSTFKNELLLIQSEARKKRVNLIRENSDILYGDYNYLYVRPE